MKGAPASYRTAHPRHLESRRRDRLFCDLYADRLAGRRGREVARRMRDLPRYAWAVAVRTATLDRWVLHAVHSRSVAQVIHLGAGFDTRPYRLELPEELLWIEVDLPPVLERKSAALAGVPPVCRLHREAVCRRGLDSPVGGDAGRVSRRPRGVAA